MFFQRRASYYRERFSSADPTTRIIALVALIILIIIALPGLWARLPGAASGSACLSLTSPRITGNNQSLLSAQADPNDLHLELAPDPIVINQGQPLTLEVRFINEGIAPATLYLPANQITFRYTDQEAGLLFSITSGGRAFGEPPNVRAPYPIPQQFQANQLHVLGPRQRCSIQVQITPDRLNAAQMLQGQYEVTAVYRNQFKGAISAVGALTPTPIFRDQGVWTGQVQSNTIQVVIGLPTQAPPPR